MKTRGKRVSAVLLLAAGAGAVAVATATWFRRHYAGVTVDGHSMIPTLSPGDRVLMRRGAEGLRRGRVVVVTRPDVQTGWRDRGPVSSDLESTDWYIKRVVAMPGDRYPLEAPERGTVPPGHVYLRGEHPDSVDSLRHGPCPIDQILGIAVSVDETPAPVIR